MIKIAFFALWLGLGAFLPAGTVSAGQNGPKELRIGVTSGKVEKRLQEFGLVARYLASRLHEFGIREGKVVVAKDLEDMLQKVRQEKVDVVFESASSTLEMEQAGMIPSLLAWRKGVREYRTLFFVRRDSPARTLDDLRGRTIVFEDRNSTSAFAIPAAELRKNGLTLAPADDAGPKTDAVRYSFSGEAYNQAYWVVQGRSDAAAFNDNDWEELPSKVRAELRVIHETKPILRYIVSLHPSLSPQMRNALENVLVSMAHDPRGKAALEGASNIRKIERLTEADFSSLAYVRSLKAYLK